MSEILKEIKLNDDLFHQCKAAELNDSRGSGEQNELYKL